MSKPQPPVWTLGVCCGGFSVLRNNELVTIEEAIKEFNSLEELRKDAERFRWLLNGHGYFMEEEGLCCYAPCSEREQQAAREEIDRYRLEDGGG